MGTEEQEEKGLRGDELMDEARKTFGMDVTEEKAGPPQSDETTGTPGSETTIEGKIESEEDLFKAAERARGQ